MYTLDRIVCTPGVVSGKPRIKGTRVTVGAILGQLAVGHLVDEVLRDYPYIQREDVLAALQYAAWRAQEEEVELSAQASGSMTVLVDANLTPYLG
jgi:uncharacterized protein (DUF433 family)